MTRNQPICKLWLLFIRVSCYDLAMQCKLFALISVSSLAVAAAAQSHAVPYVMYGDGSFFDVGYDVEGLQATTVKGKPYVPKGCVKSTASQNTQSLRMMCSEIDGTPKTPTRFSIHRAEHGKGGIAGAGRVSFTYQGLTAVYMPELDVAATQAAFFELEFLASDVTFDGLEATSPAEKDAIKAQKMWLPSNFRVSLGDMPTARINKVESFTIKQGIADLDGDGRLDFVIPEAITFTLPVEDSGPYQDWFKATSSGQETLKTLMIEYDDNDNLPVVTMIVPVSIESIGFADLFLGTTATPGRDVQVQCRARGIVACKPGTGGA